MGSPNTFDEDSSTWVHAAAIADVITGTIDGTYALADEGNILADIRTKLNLLLVACRSANIIAGD